MPQLNMRRKLNFAGPAFKERDGSGDPANEDPAWRRQVYADDGTLGEKQTYAVGLATGWKEVGGDKLVAAVVNGCAIRRLRNTRYQAV